MFELVATLLGVIFGGISTYISLAESFSKREKDLVERIREQTSREINVNRDYQSLKANYDNLTVAVKELNDDVDKKFDSVFLELKELRQELCDR